MEESVSVLDFGILRLQMRLDRNASIPSTFADFDWDRNLITLRTWSYEAQWTEEQVITACNNWFENIRKDGGVSVETGEVYPIIGSSFYSALFSHFGFVRTIDGKTTEETARELDKKFELTFHWAPFAGEVSTIKSIECTGGLLEKGYATKIQKSE